MAYRSLNSSDSQDPGWWVSQENSPEFHQTWDVEIFQSCSLGCTGCTINRTCPRFLQSMVDPFRKPNHAQATHRCQHSIGDIGVTRLYVRPGFLSWSLGQRIAFGKPNDYNILSNLSEILCVFCAIALSKLIGLLHACKTPGATFGWCNTVISYNTTNGTNGTKGTKGTKRATLGMDESREASK